MKKIDNKLTNGIRDWLDTPAKDRDIQDGATMLLQLNGNRILFNTILRKPQQMAGKLEYELRKHLKIRLAKLTVSDVVNIEKTVVPKIETLIKEDNAVTPKNESLEETASKGRRPDHDTLPPEIQELWDSNKARYEKIVILFNELKAMADLEPCDRYEVLVQLDEAEKRYRKNLALYDAYSPAERENEDNAASDVTEPAEIQPADIVKEVNAARKAISTYKSKLSKLDENDPKRTEILEKLQSAVNVVLKSGSSFSDRTRDKLIALGISLG